MDMRVFDPEGVAAGVHFRMRQVGSLSVKWTINRTGRTFRAVAGKFPGRQCRRHHLWPSVPSVDKDLDAADTYRATTKPERAIHFPCMDAACST